MASTCPSRLLFWLFNGNTAALVKPRPYGTLDITDTIRAMVLDIAE